MVSKTTAATGTASAKSGPTSFLQLGKEPTDAMLGMQKELLEAYEQASRAWVARAKAEVDLWSEFASKISTIRSAPEAMQAYQQCLADRMQLAAEDGRRLAKEYEEAMQRITRLLPSGWPTGST